MKYFHKTIASATIATTATLSICSVSAEAATFNIGTNFTGVTRSNPSSISGAVGTNQIVEFTNGSFTVYDKTTGTRLQQLSGMQFWTDIAGIEVNSLSYKPRVVYDVATGRWFASELETFRADWTDKDPTNNFLLAVSNSSDPTAGWTGFKINLPATIPNSEPIVDDPPETDPLEIYPVPVLDADGEYPSSNYLDYWGIHPTLGLDADGVYLSKNHLDYRGDGKTISVASIPKADLLSPIPTVANAKILGNLDNSQYGFSIQPALDFGASDNRAALLGTNYPPQWGASNLLQRSNLLNSGSSLANISAGVGIQVDNYSTPNWATQPHPTNFSYWRIAKDLDTRLNSNVFEVGNSLWAVHNIGVSSGGGLLPRVGIRWYEIDETTNAVLQSGTISDRDYDYFLPSIAANQFGDVVIGFNRSGGISIDGSGKNEFISSYAVLGQTTNGVTTFGNPLLLKAGLDSYNREIYPPFGIQPWGGYSATVVDPSDPFSFWTFQAFANKSDPNLGSRWSSQITQVKVARSVPEPGSVFGLLAFGVLGIGSVLKRKQPKNSQLRKGLLILGADSNNLS